MLVDVAREIASTYAQEDPLELGKQWGMIQNRNVKVSTIHNSNKYGVDIEKMNSAGPELAPHQPQPPRLQRQKPNPNQLYLRSDLCKARNPRRPKLQKRKKTPSHKIPRATLPRDLPSRMLNPRLLKEERVVCSARLQKRNLQRRRQRPHLSLYVVILCFFNAKC